MYSPETLELLIKIAVCAFIIGFVMSSYIPDDPFNEDSRSWERAAQRVVKRLRREE